MHHNVAYVIVFKEPFFILSVELEGAHALYNFLIHFIVGFGVLSAKEHFQVGFGVICDFTPKRDRTFSSEQIQFKQCWRVLHEHDICVFEKFQVDVPVLFRRDDVLHCLLQLDDLLTHLILLDLKLVEVMAGQASLPLVLPKPIQLGQLVQHLHIVHLDIVRHVRDLDHMTLIAELGA